MTKKFQYKPSGWQLDPESLEVTHTGGIQLWRNGCYAGELSLGVAKNMVSEGSAFVMCGQAVGAMVNGMSVA